MIKIILFSVIFFNYLFKGNECSLQLDRSSNKYPFDTNLYEEVLDPELCQQQLTHLTTDVGLLARFLDAGIRFPKGILLGNTKDLGNFPQCMAINEDIEDMTINGKYCRISVPLEQALVLQDSVDKSHVKFDLSEKMVLQLEAMKLQKVAVKTALGIRPGVDSLLSNLNIELAVCIPRPCSTEQALNGLIFNLTNIEFEFNEIACRLPDDRPWTTADYIAIVIFSIIGFLTVISTCYDLYHAIYLNKGTTEISVAFTSFSLYTNTRRLLTFNSSPGSLECLDGIRVLAIIWVIIGHSYFLVPEMINPLEFFQWMMSSHAAWVTVAPLSVDTFFLLSGLLLVYTSIGKFSRMQLLKNLHVFYLHRLLRIFPILAAVVLFQSSFYMRVSDGPIWDKVSTQVFACREHWWSTLLHIQNFLHPTSMCIGESWYLAIDIQLYILSPIVLFWVLTSKRAAWTALNTAFIATLSASTIYIFIKNFPPGITMPNQLDDFTDNTSLYYMNTLTRASPFLVGMIYGYVLYLYRNNQLEVPKVLTTILLLCSLLIMLVVMYCSYIALQFDGDSQLTNNFFNSYLRTLWALTLGWIIFACVQGRAEPINWFLSLRMWKLPSRLSYAMYLVHMLVIVPSNSAKPVPVYFTVISGMFDFMGFLLMTMILSFFVTLIIDSPFSTIFKLLLGGSKKSTTSKTNDENNFTNEIYGKAECSYDADEDVNKVQLNTASENDLKINITNPN